MSKVVKDTIWDTHPGMGINANPFESEMTIDLTGPMGTLTGQYYSLMFQLGRNGFATFKIEEWIEVSPAFKQYYDLTIQQRQALEGQMKAGLGQIATAIHDYELIWHDLRKYKEFMDYFTKIEQGNKMAKSNKPGEKEQGEQMKKEGVQLLKSVFIDQVDAHTGEGIALRTITQRWPTIIVDFMRLDDSDIDPKKIAQKHQFTEAEGAVLATKNKLFIEWRDNLFKPTLTERYKNMLRLTEARKTSIKRYTEMLKPVIARYKLIQDGLENGTLNLPGKSVERTSFFTPGSQAYSIDFARIWAILPFAPAEKYKATRDYLDKISPGRAGFTRGDIEEINAERKKKGEDPVTEVSALPMEPSIDDIVRNHIHEVEKEYKVKINMNDVFQAREQLVKLFSGHAMETIGGRGSKPGATWNFSPYFVFLDIPFQRTVIRLPNGQELEDLWIENMTVQNRSQNVIIISLLEVIAREKQLDNYINQLIGEVGGTGLDLKTIEELAEEQFPELYGKERKEEKKKKESQDRLKGVKKVGGGINNVLKQFGFDMDVLRARGPPYEFAMQDRIAELYQLEVNFQGYLYVKAFLQQGAKVPGVSV